MVGSTWESGQCEDRLHRPLLGQRTDCIPFPLYRGPSRKSEKGIFILHVLAAGSHFENILTHIQLELRSLLLQDPSFPL